MILSNFHFLKFSQKGQFQAVKLFLTFFDRPTNRPTDRPIDIATYRAAIAAKNLLTIEAVSEYNFRSDPKLSAEAEIIWVFQLGPGVAIIKFWNWYISFVYFPTIKMVKRIISSHHEQLMILEMKYGNNLLFITITSLSYNLKLLSF